MKNFLSKGFSKLKSIFVEEQWEWPHIGRYAYVTEKCDCGRVFNYDDETDYLYCQHCQKAWQPWEPDPRI